MAFVELIPFSTCWEWAGALDKRGYGRFWLGGRKRLTVFAHRALYELLVGPVPERLELDHLCMRPSCVNPSHLEPVTHRENLLREWRARGHLLGRCRLGRFVAPEVMP